MLALAVLCGAALLPQLARAQGFEQPLCSFGSPGATEPQAAFVIGADGALYSTTEAGGTGGWGTVFRFDPNSLSYSILHSFTGAGGDGATPYAALLPNTDGELYGTTYRGGANGVGTIFKIGTSGAGYSVIYNFTGANGDGANPTAGLIRGGDGALYGTTYGGGTNNHGTVFQISADGTGYSIIHSFTGAKSDGAVPDAPLILGADGMFYGTTYGGGTNNHGTVFRLGPGGTGFSVLHSFTGTNGDGAQPESGLMQGADGALYGTTYEGGSGSGYGTVFRIATNGTGYTVLYRFQGAAAGDGAYPFAALFQGADGALYSTAQYGGDNSLGTVFRIGTDGTGYSILYSFTGTNGDGTEPEASLMQGADGALYGTTYAGGNQNLGTVFRSVIPRIISLTQGADHSVTLSCVSLPNASTRLWATTNLAYPAAWRAIYTNTSTSANGTWTYTDSAGPPRFYRFSTP